MIQFLMIFVACEVAVCRGGYLMLCGTAGQWDSGLILFCGGFVGAVLYNEFYKLRTWLRPKP